MEGPWKDHGGTMEGRVNIRSCAPKALRLCDRTAVALKPSNGIDPKRVNARNMAHPFSSGPGSPVSRSEGGIISRSAIITMKVHHDEGPSR